MSETLYKKYSPALHCRACDRDMEGSHDGELCNGCMAVVHELLKDIDKPDDDVIWSELGVFTDTPDEESYDDTTVYAMWEE